MEWITRINFFIIIVWSLLPSLRSEDTTSIEYDVTARSCYQKFREKIAYCAYRSLETVPQTLNYDIIIISLSYNKITGLFNGSFSKYHLLEYLYLNDNDITFIETGTLYSLNNLRMLALNDNRDLHIPNSILFRRSTQLIELDLRNCSLQSFPNDTLKWLPRLERLYLNNNRISAFNITHCPKEERLDYVSLTYNSMYLLSNETFSFTCKCSVFEFLCNPFEWIDPFVISRMQAAAITIGTSYCRPSKFPYSWQVLKNMFRGVSQSLIQYVWIGLTNNGTFYAPVNLFNQLTGRSLSELRLDSGCLQLYPSFFTKLTLNQLTIVYTSLEVIHPEYFDGLLRLHVLVLSYNKISDINPRQKNWNLPYLTELDIGQNFLLKLSYYALKGLKHLLKLDLSRNANLAYIDALFFSELPNLRYLDVSRTMLLSDVSDHYYLPNLVSLSFSDRIPDAIGRNPFIWPGALRHALSLESIVFDNSQFALYNLWGLSLNKSIFDRLYHVKSINLRVIIYQSCRMVYFRIYQCCAYST